MDGILTNYFIIGKEFSIIIITNNLKLKAMKKLIAAILVTFTVNANAQILSQLEKFAPDSIFETYVVGANDEASIGILKDIFTEPTAKEKYSEINPKIESLQVTGTAAPFTKRVPFSKWINDYVKSGQYPSSQIKYTVSNRSDGMVQEFLVIFKDGNWQRTVIISRMSGSIISIWDSALN